MDGLAGWVISPSGRRVLVATTATRLARLGFLEKKTGFWIVSGCQPHAHVNKQLPKMVQGWLHHTPFGPPSFTSVKDNLSLPTSRTELDQLQDKLSCSPNAWVV